MLYDIYVIPDMNLKTLKSGLSNHMELASDGGNSEVYAKPPNVIVNIRDDCGHFW